MSQIATLNNSEATGAIIGAENANPNSESVILNSKHESAENLICSEKLRSESSTPVKETHEEQPAANNQSAGDIFDKIQITMLHEEFYLQLFLLNFCFNLTQHSAFPFDSFSELVQEKQSQNIEVPNVLERSSSETAAAEEIAAPSAEVPASESQPSSDAKDAAPAQSVEDAGVKRTVDNGDNAPVSKAVKGGE
jgi:hypothetical protein